MTENKDIPLPLIAREYLITLLSTSTDSDQHELQEVLLYLNNLITLDEINEQKLQ